MTLPSASPISLADSDVLIELERGNPKAVAWNASLPTPLTVPGPAVWELLSGPQNKADLRRIQRFLSGYAVLWPGEPESRQAADYIAAYRLSHGIGINDAVIAACAVLSGATLYTFNLKHYRVIPNLTVMAPFVR